MPENSSSVKQIDHRTVTVIIVVILSMTFAIRSSNNMYVTSVPLLARYYFFFSNVEIGLLASAASLTTFIMSTFINAKVESRARRKIFIISSILYAVVFPFFYISTPLTIWLILPVASFTLGSIMPNIITSASLFKDRKQRERILSIYTLTLSLSLILGPYIESELLHYVSLPESFLIFSILPAIGMIDSFFIKFPDEMGVRRRGFDITVLKDRGFQSSLLNILAYNIPFAFLTTYGGLFGISDFKVSLSTVNLTFSLFFLTSFISRLVFSVRVPERLPRLMFSAVILSAIGLLVLGTAKNYDYFVLAFLILGIPHGLTYPLSVMSITRSFPENRRNMANSYFFSIMMAIGTIMPFISGEVIKIIGYRNAFLVVIPVIFVILATLYFVLKAKGREESASITEKM
ncbi:MAG: MFS transporter [Candidatus Thermoplasmatota archaeon]|nr:MFS transporter [Candidatus Thermoplasmatota archaeon]